MSTTNTPFEEGLDKTVRGLLKFDWVGATAADYEGTIKQAKAALTQLHEAAVREAVAKAKIAQSRRIQRHLRDVYGAETSMSFRGYFREEIKLIAAVQRGSN